MNKDILSTVSCNKTVSLFPVKPFYCSFCHGVLPLLLKPPVGKPGYPAFVFLKMEDIFDEMMTWGAVQKMYFAGQDSSQIYSFSDVRYP
jgi:hypothetical protein